MLGWLAVCSVPVILVALTDAAVSPLVMARLVRVPREVMLGWLAVCSVPVRVFAVRSVIPVRVPLISRDDCMWVVLLGSVS